MSESLQGLSGHRLSKTSVREFLEQWVDARENRQFRRRRCFACRDSVKAFLGFLGDRSDSDIIYITTPDFANFRDQLARNVAARTATGSWCPVAHSASLAKDTANRNPWLRSEPEDPR
ncbi:MAG: hypothetical protein R3F19_26000 [Verrucomicrobiales bacterium]